MKLYSDSQGLDFLIFYAYFLKTYLLRALLDFLLKMLLHLFSHLNQSVRFFELRGLCIEWMVAIHFAGVVEY